jgi:hypothetical protein
MVQLQIHDKSSGKQFTLYGKVEMPELEPKTDDTNGEIEIRTQVNATFINKIKAFIDGFPNTWKAIPIVGEYRTIMEIRKEVTHIEGTGAFSSRYLWLATKKGWEKIGKKSEFMKKKKMTI